MRGVRSRDPEDPAIEIVATQTKIQRRSRRSNEDPAIEIVATQTKRSSDWNRGYTNEVRRRGLL